MHKKAQEVCIHRHRIKLQSIDTSYQLSHPQTKFVSKQCHQDVNMVLVMQIVDKIPTTCGHYTSVTSAQSRFDISLLQ